MKLFLVGFGQGNYEGMTIKAKECIENSHVIVGYTVYVELIKRYFPDKEYLSTPMRKEIDRISAAIELAAEGKHVAVICSGDSVVYGMAGLAFELLRDYKDKGGKKSVGLTEGGKGALPSCREKYEKIEIEVIPGVTAALSGSALLGAVLTHDFCVISLSDLLTSWDKIEKRLECAAMADFEIVIYNPVSKKRADYLKKACDIILKYRDKDCVCGYAMNIGRDEESYQVTTLSKLRNMELNMFTTVFIGNTQTMNIDGKMVTPRGYSI